MDSPEEKSVRLTLSAGDLSRSTIELASSIRAARRAPSNRVHCKNSDNREEDGEERLGDATHFVLSQEQMTRKQKGGDMFETLFASGVGAFAAKNSSSMGGLLWTLAKYALVIIAILLVVYIVLGLLRVSTETFVPIVPSAEGDKKTVTPAGNVIMY